MQKRKIQKAHARSHTQRESDWSCEQYSEREREKERLKEKPPTWSSYIRTTEGKSKSKFGHSEIIMLLDTAYTRSELKLNVHFSQQYCFKLPNRRAFSLTERAFLQVHI